MSLPHGWGHDVADARLEVAKRHPGVNANILTDDRRYDEASGTAILFGTPVTVEPSLTPPLGGKAVAPEGAPVMAPEGAPAIISTAKEVR